MKKREKLRRILPLFLAAVLCFSQCMPTAALASAGDAEEEEETAETEADEEEDSGSTEDNAADGSSDSTGEDSSGSEEAAAGDSDGTEEEDPGSVSDDSDDSAGDSGTEEDADSGEEEVSGLALESAELMSVDDSTVDTSTITSYPYTPTLENSGAYVYSVDPFDEAYSSGYFCCYNPTKSDGVNYANGGYYGSNTEKDEDIYLIWEDGVCVNGVYYDVVQYPWLEEGNDTVYWLIDSSAAVIARTLNSSGSWVNGSGYATIYMEFHFYESGHALEDEYEVSFSGVMRFSDMDANEGWGFEQGLIAAWLNDGTYVKYQGNNTWLGSTNNDNDNSTTSYQNQFRLWAEVTGSAEEPLVMFFYAPAGMGGGINYEGTSVNYVLVENEENVLPESAAPATYYCATYGNYTPVSPTVLFDDEAEAARYVFSGWYYDEDLTEPVETDEDGNYVAFMVSSATTLYGTFYKTANAVNTSVVHGTISDSVSYLENGEGTTVTYSPDTGYTLASITVTETDTEGTKTVISLPDSDGSYSCSTTLSSGTQLTISGSSVVVENIQEDLLVEVVYEAIRYNVRYNSNYSYAAYPEGVSTDSTCLQSDYLEDADALNYDVTYTILDNYFTVPDGYAFAGWNTSADGNGTSYAVGDDFSNLTTTEDGIIDLYAQWTVLYTLTYDPNCEGYEGSMDPEEYVSGTAVTVKDSGYSHDLYTFTGWNTEKDGTGTSYAADDGFEMPSGDVTLYAQWTFEFTFVKVSAQSTYTYDTYSTYVLEGAEFSLYEYVGEDETALTEILDSSDYNAGTWNLVAEESASGSDGAVSFTGLDDGTTYRLIETASPEGYTIPEGQWNVVLSLDEGTGDVRYTFTAVGSAPGAARLESEDGDTYVYVLQNEELKELPSTSGTGWKSLAWIGLVPMAAGAAILAGCYLYQRQPAQPGCEGGGKRSRGSGSRPGRRERHRRSRNSGRE